MSKGLSKKQLRKPDEFVTFWARVAQFTAAKRRQVAAGAIALAVVVAVAMAISSWTERSALAQTQAFERILKVAVAELLPAEGQPPRYEDGVPHFKTDRERAEAAAREADGFVAAHPSSRLRDKALLLKAGYLADAGKLDEAVAAYGTLAGGAIDPSLRFLAQEGLGLALEAKNDLDKADAAYARLADEASGDGGFYRDRALYSRGRVAERRGNPKDAETYYREVLDKIPTSKLRDEISDRLAALEAK